MGKRAKGAGKQVKPAPAAGNEVSVTGHQVIAGKVGLKVEILKHLKASGGLNVYAACDAVGITTKTFYDWAKKDSAFADAARHTKMRGLAAAKDTAYQMAITPDPKCHADRKYVIGNLSRQLDPDDEQWKEASVITAEGQIELKHTAAYDFLREAAGVKPEPKVIEGKAR